MMGDYKIISERQEKVLHYLEEHNIPFTTYNHPEGKTIEEAKRWWHDDGSMHCKNIFMRNHKGDQHYLICFPCDDDLAIHDIEHWLKDVLVSQGMKAPGKLSFASPERMMRYLGLEPGSVSPFGLINDTEHHVILFLDRRLKDAPSLSFHPNDCRGTVVITQEAFQKYLTSVGNKWNIFVQRQSPKLPFKRQLEKIKPLVASLFGLGSKLPDGRFCTATDIYDKAVLHVRESREHGHIAIAVAGNQHRSGIAMRRRHIRPDAVHLPLPIGLLIILVELRYNPLSRNKTESKHPICGQAEP